MTGDPVQGNFIIIAQINPDRGYKLLGCSADPDAAARQIAKLVGHSRKPRIVHTVSRPEYEAMALWVDYAAQGNGEPINRMASNIALETGSGIAFGSTYGTAFFSGYNLQTGTISSLPVDTFTKILGRQAYANEAKEIRAWVDAQGSYPRTV
jgi:hypothetical protein